MKKITKKELMLKVKENGFDLDNMFNIPIIRPYHYHEWDHGYYSTLGYQGTKREFYQDLKEMVDFLYEYLNYFNVKNIIIAPLHRFNIFAWEGDMKKDYRYNDIYIEAMDFLKKNNVKKNSQCGIEVEINTNREIIELILEGAYRYVLELCIFIPERAVIIEPTHHFDLMFFVKDFKNQKKVIKKIISRFPNIIYYEYIDKAN